MTGWITPKMIISGIRDMRIKFRLAITSESLTPWTRPPRGRGAARPPVVVRGWGLVRWSADPLAHHLVSRAVQRPRDLRAVLRPLGLQVQFHLHLREPQPRVGPYVAHVQHVRIDH